jgi:ABC-2 type transport system permease protein
MSPEPAPVVAGWGRVSARFTARRAVRSGATWGAVFAFSITTTATGYNASFPTEQSRQKLAQSFGTNRGVAALLGPARNVANVAGFTAWRITVILSVIGAGWGLLTATRMLRAEEDAGRWEILLSGQTTRGRAAAQAVVGLLAGWVALWAIAAGGAVAVGRIDDVGFSVTASLFFATTLTATAALFLAVGAVTSQLAATRRQANMLGAATIGVSYLLRMVADSSDGSRWLRWTTPVGWAEELRPLTASHPAVLALFVTGTALLVVAAVRLAQARDLGDSALPSTDVREPHLALLDSAGGLTARLTFPTFGAWVGGLALCGLVFGLVAQSGADALSSSTTIEEAIARIGGRAGGAAAYLGITFLVAAMLVAIAAAGLVSASRSEEDEGHLDTLLVRPVSRTRWFVGRMGAAAAVVVVASAASGVTAWLGAASQGTAVGFVDLFEAGLNIAPPALVVLGIGALVLGIAPRRAPAVAYAVVAWSALVELIGSVTTTNDLLLDTSVFHHTGPAPAAPVDWHSIAVLVAIALAMTALGLVAFRRRDLAGA